jgi:hypothetical protein
MARELGPRGIHVVHVIVDGIVNVPGEGDWSAAENTFVVASLTSTRRRPHTAGIDQRFGPAPAGSRIEPDAVAETYAMLAEQPPSAWTHEVDIRPSVEKW